MEPSVFVDYIQSEYEIQRPKYAMKFLYTAHPSENLLAAACPTQFWDAHERSFEITAAQLRSMRDAVIRLGDEVREIDPDLSLFFATGAIPYVLPLLNRLGNAEFERNPDAPRFHLFPGLSWAGRFESLTSDALFRRDLELLIQGLSLDRSVRILCIDTTNTGNAINKLLKETLAVVSDISCRIDVRVIGIVNSPRATAQTEDAIQIRERDEVLAKLLPPSDWNIRRIVADREFQEIWPATSSTSARFHLSYWSQEVFTEDVCMLIGATHLVSSLGLEANDSTGRLKIASSAGSTTTGSLGTVASQLLTLLSQDDSSAGWKEVNANEAISRGAVGHEQDPVIGEALQMFEIDETENAIEAILKKKGLLTAAEVRALNEAHEFTEKALRKVMASRREKVDDDLLQTECRRFCEKHEKWSIRTKTPK